MIGRHTLVCVTDILGGKWPEDVKARAKEILKDGEVDPTAALEKAAEDLEAERERVRLADIAKKYYGDRSQWKPIADANGITQPERLRAGVSITIPPLHPTPERPRRREPSESRSYTVQSGDTLTIIAEQQLGRQSRWREIQEYNGIDDTLIVPGQELKLPTR